MPARPATAAGPATALAAVLVVVAVLAATLGGPLSLRARPQVAATWTATPAATPAATPTPVEVDAERVDPTPWVVGLVRGAQVLVGIALLVALALLLRYATRGWRRDVDDGPPDGVPPGDEPDEELGETAVAALREGVRVATRALEDDVPAGDAVIGAWVAVETAAARTGVRRDRAQTASEFALRVLDATPADPAATRELLDLYLTARFGTHGVGADEVRRARELLRVVGRGLVADDGTDPAGPAGPGLAGPADAGRADVTGPADPSGAGGAS